MEKKQLWFSHGCGHGWSSPPEYQKILQWCQYKSPAEDNPIWSQLWKQSVRQGPTLHLPSKQQVGLSVAVALPWWWDTSALFSRLSRLHGSSSRTRTRRSVWYRSSGTLTRYHSNLEVLSFPVFDPCTPVLDHTILTCPCTDSWLIFWSCLPI